MKRISPHLAHRRALAAALSLAAMLSLCQAQTTFTGDGDWLESDRWDGDVPADNSTAIINGNAIISEDITTQNSINPSRIEIGSGADGSLTVDAGPWGALTAVAKVFSSVLGSAAMAL